LNYTPLAVLPRGGRRYHHHPDTGRRHAWQSWNGNSSSRRCRVARHRWSRTKQQTNRARQGRLNSRILRLHVSLARDNPFELSYRKGKCHTSPNLSPQLSIDAGDEAFLLKTRATTDHESWLFHYANPVTNIPAIVTEAIADIGFGLLIAVARNIALGDRLLRTGVYPGPRFQLSRRRTDARSAWLVSVVSVKPWRGAAAVST
jgi:hypothetical protein